MKILTIAALMMISAGALAAQQTHFACRTRASSVITVQEDAAGSISLNRTEAEKIPELGITAMTQKQILVADPGDSIVTSTDNGNTKVITLNFHGSSGDSQVVLKMRKILFGQIQLMDISGTGAALARMQNMISSSELGVSFGGCRIEMN
jgi:hypothetical protein